MSTPLHHIFDQASFITKLLAIFVSKRTYISFRLGNSRNYRHASVSYATNYSFIYQFLIISFVNDIYSFLELNVYLHIMLLTYMSSCATRINVCTRRDLLDWTRNGLEINRIESF